jgi:hypothetical protein
MAIVPWSYSVNVGSLANSVRGTPTAGVPISAVTYLSTSTKTITAITRDDPGKITVSGKTGLAEGDWVYISGVKGMTQINGRYGTVKNMAYSGSNTTFNLRVGNSNLCTENNDCGNWNSYTSSGVVTKCLVSSCLEVVTTSANHGIAAGESVYIADTVGTDGVNNGSNSAWIPTVLTTTTYSLPGTSPSNGIRTSGGTSYCVKYGCSYYYFTNADGNRRRWQPNNCVTDRTTDPYTDTPPSTTKFNFHYTSDGSNCIDNQIVPLTASKPTLHAAIGVHDPVAPATRTLVAKGSTAGHLGLAWGWYMIAPNFAYLWPSAAPAPKAYGTANLVKAVIFMTDGVFNTPYCNGVTASDAVDPGSPGTSSRINCASPNGSSKSQATALCNSIKVASNNTHLYVVGFDLANDSDTLSFLQGCATDVQHFYRADTGTDLENAFRAIAQNLSDLRISR